MQHNPLSLRGIEFTEFAAADSYYLHQVSKLLAFPEPGSLKEKPLIIISKMTFIFY